MRYFEQMIWGTGLGIISLSIWSKRNKGMTKNAWKKRIQTSCEQAGTYEPFFDDVIDTLAGILERRDAAEKAMKGEDLTVEHINKGGNSNIERHPLTRMIDDLNRDALSYWRDLGLTPKGLKAIKEDALKKEPVDKLSEALKGLGV